MNRNIYAVDRLVALAALLLLLGNPALSHADAMQMQLVNINGEEEPLSNYIGQGDWVVVNVWSPSCSACVLEIPRLKRFMQRNPEIPVLGITLDFPSFDYGDMNILRDFVSTTPLNYPLFLADHEQASEVIGRHLVGIPLVAIYRPDGKPVARWPGVIEIDEIEKLIQDYEEDTDPLSAGFE